MIDRYEERGGNRERDREKERQIESHQETYWQKKKSWNTKNNFCHLDFCGINSLRNYPWKAKLEE